jgi:hypothetical protein
MLCDVCNVTINETAPRIPADEFRTLLDRGFGINETNVQMVMRAGLSREQAIQKLTDMYRTSQSDWVLCDSCYIKARGNLTS